MRALSVALAVAGFAACATPAAPDVRAAGDRLVFLREPPTTMTAGVAVNAGIRVAIVDGQGAVVLRSGVPVTVRLVAPLPPDSLPPAALLTTTDGVAALAPFSVSRALVNVQLVAASPGLTGILSQTFSVVPAPAPPP